MRNQRQSSLTPGSASLAKGGPDCIQVLVRDEMAVIMRVHPKPRVVIVASYLIVLAWAEIAVFIVFFLISAIGSSETLAGPATVALMCLIPTASCYFALALLLHCPYCNRRFLLQTLGKKHPSARTVLGMDYWATTVIDVITRAEVTCMYCGEKCLVEISPGKNNDGSHTKHRE